MNKKSQIAIVLVAGIFLGLTLDMIALHRPARLFSMLMIAAVAKKAEESISARMGRIKNDEEGQVFDEFQKRHPSYIPVLFPLSRGGPGYMGCDLDFNAGSRFSSIFIQPGLRVLAFERGVAQAGRSDMDGSQLSAEVHDLFKDLRKNSPGEYSISEFDMNAEMDNRHEITEDIVRVASKIPAPHLCTETFVHKQAIEELERSFSGSVKCVANRCIVGNKMHVPVGLGRRGKDLPQSGRWFDPNPST